MLWNTELKGQLPDSEINAIADKLQQYAKCHATPNSFGSEDYNEAIRAWVIIGLRDTLTALHDLGYALVKTTVGIFQPIELETAATHSPETKEEK